tara:strand:+ start:322 stop:1026 length:705 start_codon:yes stop_codon:yes gene_type:complete
MKPIIVEIPDYLRRVKLSNARRAKYYELGKALPKAKKYADTKLYEWRVRGKKSFLYDKKTDERVIANPKAAGTPNVMVINGQKIYNGEMNPNMRAKIMNEIKSSFYHHIKHLKPIPKKYFPLKIELEIHDTIREERSGCLWDADNRAYPYTKAFQDCLTGSADKTGEKRIKQIIPDDNILFVSTAASPKFIPIAIGEQRKIVFTISQETDERVIKNKEYTELLEEEFNKLTEWN